MIELRPFRAWRPSADKAHLVGSRSYISYSREELADKLAGNPYTFLHVIHPEESSHHQGTRAERFDRIRSAFKGFCDEGILERDPEPCIYVYEQRMRGGVSRGIIAGVSNAAYRDGRIKVHEQTLTARENLFAEYLAHTGMNAEPVLLCTPDGTDWPALLEPIAATRPDQDFTTTDRVRHRLWAVSDPLVRRRLQEAFAQVPALYIADGHHRMASSARLAEQTGATGSDARAWCLAFIVPEHDLHIYNFDRLVVDVDNATQREVLEALRNGFGLESRTKPCASPGTVGLRCDEGWFRFHLNPAPTMDAVAQLDADRLSAQVLGPLLGINDLRSDPRIRFMPGADGTEPLEKACNAPGRMGFHLNPITFAALKAVADTGGTMPPKSTYIEPKLRSGLVIYPLEHA